MERGTKASRSKKTKDKTDLRLSRDVRPSHYAVHIAPNLEAGTFAGRVEIDLELKRPTASVEIHAVDLALRAVRIRRGRDEQAGTVQPRPRRETVEIRFPQALRAGKAKLAIEFDGVLQKHLRGFYAASSSGRRYAFTQLEATDARRFFPCFDEPAMKARFTFSVTAKDRHTVISNSPVRRVRGHGHGEKTVEFATTPPLSTYLCALAVGDLEGSKVRRVGRTPIRVWHVPGKGHLCAFALEAAAESLARLEHYFGLPYPYAKLDLVAVPDFEAGAMENAGAVFFRETLLLVDPASITLAEKKRVAEVIAHELAHMWYGDLVTMAWWNDLWLNEAFATWMAFRVIDAWHPEWRMWNNFEHHRAAALSLDALAHTHPIYAEVRDPAQATENFDLITYEKGASVVRMIENYLGPAAFRRGVQAYIRRHRQGNAEAADLWRALEKASGQRVNRVVRAWIEQSGYPLVETRRIDRGGRAGLEVRQRRFLAKPKAKTASQQWPVPLVVKVGNGGPPRLVRHLLTKRRDRVGLGRASQVRWCYANAAEGGFYRPLHDRRTLAALASNSSRWLSAVERMGLVGHQWALLRAGHARIETVLDLVGGLGGETDFDVLAALGGPLGFIEDQLLDVAGPHARPHFQRWLASLFGPAWKDLGWTPARREPDDPRLRRAALLRLVGDLAEEPRVVAASAQRFSRYLRDRNSLEPNLADAVVSIAARHGGAEEYEALRAAVRRARTPQERRRFELALADFRRPALVRRTLSMLLTDAVATQDVGLFLVRFFGNRAARELTWDFFKRQWKPLSERLPPMMISRVVDATPALGTRAYKKDVAAFFRAHPVPTAARSVRQALERFDLNDELRRRVAKDLGRWLAA